MSTKPGEDLSCEQNHINSEKLKNHECNCGDKSEQAINAEPEESILKQNDDAKEKQGDLKKTIEEMQKEIDEYKNRWLRAQADFDNYRKRIQRDIQDIHLYAGEQLVKDISPVIVNLQRALIAVDTQNDSLYKGVELIYQQLIEILKKHEIKEIEALGKPFDPSYHDAVMIVENQEYKPDTVAEVMLKGYTYHSKVIRPSMVKVAKN